MSRTARTESDQSLDHRLSLWYNGREMHIAQMPHLVHETAFVASNVSIVGEVHVGARASVWFGCVLRAEYAAIVIGARTNIQDLTVVHADVQQPCVLGEGVSVGHRAVVHGATIGDGALIGIGAVILNGATIGRGALVGAGALVTQGFVLPDRHLALGMPARVIRQLTADEIENQRTIAAQYVQLAQAYASAGFQAKCRAHSEGAC